MGISRKNIYHSLGKQKAKDEELKENILGVWVKHPAYGHKRLSLELGVSRERVRRVMKIFSLKVPRRKIHYYTTRSISSCKYTNLIKDLIVERKNQLWCSDLSYFKFHGMTWYVTSIEDIYTRVIIGYQVGKFHNSELVLTTLKQAIQSLGTIPDIFHSDQGTEFMAKVCTNYLEELGTKVSVSDKASPWQNGYQESFFGKFKDELGNLDRFESVGEMIEAIYQQINYYNTQRIHTALKMPPQEFAELV